MISNMKYSVYILVVLVLHTIFSCTHKFDEYNDNPNDMDMGTIHPLSLLQEIVFSGCDGMLYRTWLLNGELIQYTVSATTTNAYHRYIIQNGVMASCWNHLAQWAANADHMRELAEEQNDDNSQAIALTMRALYVSNLTDMFGDIPFSEVFQGRTGNTIPAFDTQKEVYEQLFKDLELANSLYNSAGLTHPTKDILFNGDVKKWQKFTNSLYMRLLMRVSGRSEMNVGEKLTEIINSPDVYPIFLLMMIMRFCTLQG